MMSELLRVICRERERKSIGAEAGVYAVPARAAFDENLTRYQHPQNGRPTLFAFNAPLIDSDGTGSFLVEAVQSLRSRFEAA